MLKLKTLLLAGVGSIALAGVFISTAMIYVSSQLHTAALGIGSAIEGLRASEETAIRLLQMNRAHVLYMLTGEQHHLQRREEAGRFLDLQRVRMRAAADQLGERSLIAEADAAIAAHVAEVANGAPPGTTSRSHDRAIGAIEEVIEHAIVHADQFRSEIARQDRIANMLGAVAIAVFAAALLGAAIVYRRFVLAPILSLQQVIAEYGAGDTRARPAVGGAREIREVAGVFDAMAGDIERQKASQLRFLAAIAHDLRNPLGAIALSAENLSRRAEMPAEDRRKIAGIIQRQALLLNRMVGDLLDTARIQGGKLPLDLQAVELVQLVADAVELHRPLSSGHHLQLVAPEQPIDAMLDPLRISQVLNNLINNAIKYSPHGGQVEVTVQQREGEVQICVSDRGIGIQPDEMKRIFEPFRRSTQTQHTIPGVGLGLSVARRIVEAHGGMISVDSTPGVGSRFCVLLPVKPATVPVASTEVRS